MYYLTYHLALASSMWQAAALKIFFSFVTFAFFSYSSVQNKYEKDTFYTLRDAHPGTNVLLWRRIGVFRALKVLSHSF